MFIKIKFIYFIVYKIILKSYLHTIILLFYQIGIVYSNGLFLFFKFHVENDVKFKCVEVEVNIFDEFFLAG